MHVRALGRFTRLGIAWLVSSALGCARPATVVEVHLDSDISLTERMTVRVAALRSDVAPQWREIGTFGPDTERRLPASFSVVSATEQDSVVRLLIEADIAPPRQRQLRREVRLSFRRGLLTSTRVFLSSRCTDARTGCIAPGPCTLSLYCLERGLTCGDEGRCESPDAPPAALDGPMSDATEPSDAASPIDVRPSCVEGATACVGAALQRCTAGAFTTIASCATVALCAPSGCRAPACSVGQLRCNGRLRERCNDDRTGYVRVETCATDALCAPSRCAAPACGPGELRCNGANREQCNAGRTGWAVLQSCATAALCTPSSCTPPACNVGDRRCDGEALQACRIDRTGWSTIQNCSGCDRCSPMGCFDACA
ncbi:MAG: hypothetical protein JNK05_02000 [Myxococcales bacterium]|nr:hypothetical protein [Myxococcales bacterium]